MAASAGVPGRMRRDPSTTDVSGEAMVALVTDEWLATCGWKTKSAAGSTFLVQVGDDRTDARDDAADSIRRGARGIMGGTY
jgi:hypothetical protein